MERARMYPGNTLPEILFMKDLRLKQYHAKDTQGRS